VLTNRGGRKSTRNTFQWAKKKWKKKKKKKKKKKEDPSADADGKDDGVKK
jgi:hypothetical protein